MTPDEEVRIRLHSDGPLLEEAVAFAAGKELPSKQINGLLAFAQGEWRELEAYITHQAERNWPKPRDRDEHPTGQFYHALKSKLPWLRQQAQAWDFVPAGLTKAQTRERTDAAAVRLAREFVQHLAAELFYRGGGT